MKVNLSPLKIVDFFIIKSSFDFTSPEPDIVVAETFSKHEIDFDFARTNGDKFYQVFVKASINMGENKIPGYHIFSEGCAIFQLDITDLPKEAIDNYLNYTSLVIAINYLRNYISLLTSTSPMGKYVLPSIELKSLIEQKIKGAPKTDAIKVLSKPKKRK